MMMPPLPRLVTRTVPLLGVVVLVAGCAAPRETVALEGEVDRPRLIVLTDIGGDPDDQQSMIRLLHYANEFRIEALIASASGTPGELAEAVVRPDLIAELVDAYGEVRDNLALHAAGFPAAAELRARIVSGNPQRGREHVGEGHDTEGSRRIIEIVDAGEPPVDITIWGGQTDLAQALWRVRAERGEEGLRDFVARIRVYDIADQDGIGEWMRGEFPIPFYILSRAHGDADRREAAFRGMYLGGDESLTSREWIDTHLRVGHGPLGALYPVETWTAPNPHGTLKEGDTPAWFYFLPLGPGDAAQPGWGGWGGRFEPSADEGIYRDAADVVGDSAGVRATVWRWRDAFQRDLAARADWAVKPYAEANHAPVVRLAGARERAVAAGDWVELDASGSTDPDGDALVYRWWVYPEAGTYRGAVRLIRPEEARAVVEVPADAAGSTIHVILEVTDFGEPALTRYGRVVLEVG